MDAARQLQEPTADEQRASPEGARLVDPKSDSVSDAFPWIQELSGVIGCETVTVYLVPQTTGRAQLLFDPERAAFVTGPEYSEISYRRDLERFEVRRGFDVTLFDHRTGRAIEGGWYQDLERRPDGAIVGMTGSGPVTVRDSTLAPPPSLASMTIAMPPAGNPRMVGSVRVIRENGWDFVAGPGDAPVSERFYSIRAAESTAYGGRRESLIAWRGDEGVLLLRTEDGRWEPGPTRFQQFRLREGRIEVLINEEPHPDYEDVWAVLDPRTGMAHDLPHSERAAEGNILLPPSIVFDEREVGNARVRRAGDIEWFIDTHGIPVSDSFHRIELIEGPDGKRPVGVYDGKHYLLGATDTPTVQYSKPHRGFQRIAYDSALGAFVGENDTKRFVLSSSTGEALHQNTVLRAQRVGATIRVTEADDSSLVGKLLSSLGASKTRTTAIDAAAPMFGRQVRSTPEGADTVLKGWLACLGELRIGNVVYHDAAKFRGAFGGDLRGIAVTDPGGERHGILVRHGSDGRMHLMGVVRGTGIITFTETSFTDLYFDTSIGHLVGRLLPEHHLHHLVSVGDVDRGGQLAIKLFEKLAALDYVVSKGEMSVDSHQDESLDIFHGRAILTDSGPVQLNTKRLPWKQSLVYKDMLAHRI